MTTAVDPDAPWQTRGACAVTADPDLWFDPSDRARDITARACRRCPVLTQCEIDTDRMPRGQQYTGQTRAARWWPAPKTTTTRGARA